MGKGEEELGIGQQMHKCNGIYDHVIQEVAIFILWYP